MNIDDAWNFDKLELPETGHRQRTMPRNQGAVGIPAPSRTELPDPEPGKRLLRWESQRIRLASQVGSGRSNPHILDEPSIGLYQRDNEKTVATLASLRDLGNTVIVVEHDLDNMRAADWLVDLGARRRAQWRQTGLFGTPSRSAPQAPSPGNFSLASETLPAGQRPEAMETSPHSWRCRHNLKNLDVSIPLGTTCVTGVSGSGKSTRSTASSAVHSESTLT